MFDDTLKVYATRAALSLILALAVVTSLVGVESSDARQPPLDPLGHAVVTGHAQAIDGDTIVVGGIRVRLEGIDAPEADQQCTDKHGRDWACGVEARRALARLVALAPVRCEERGLDKYRRVLGVCWVGATEINAELVRRGLAWAFVRYSRSYSALEAEARSAGIGVWAGHAQPAWDYRAGRWQASEASEETPKGCPIKGNVTENGRIYHLPWSPWYDRIRMDGTKGKRWFCSEGEAIAAGWRAARVY